MASKRNQRRRDCEKKRRFHSWVNADFAARSFCSAHPCEMPMRAYQCHFGNHFHVGHSVAGDGPRRWLFER